MRAIFYLLLLGSFTAQAQPAVYSSSNAHSHNDYEQTNPFFDAYRQQFGSIEADVFLDSEKDELWVAHTAADLAKNKRSLDSLYLKPLATYIRSNQGNVWSDASRRLQLMIDLKTAAIPTLNLLVKKLQQYPEITACSNLKIVISGSRPDPSQFSSYPAFIWFDGNIGTNYSAAALSRIAMLSAPLTQFTPWNGKGRIPENELKPLELAISKVHELQKPVRFWGTADNINTWYTLMNLKADFINTDQIQPMADFLGKLNKNLSVGSQPHEVYTPTFKSDGVHKKVKNVILLIGDGMALPQIYAGYTANRGKLSIFNIRNTGLSKTSSHNHFITDSAPGSTAFSSGVKTNNRFVGVDHTGAKLPLIPEIIHPQMVSGIITAGDITDATPADFYAHRADRDSSAAILHDLTGSPAKLVMGSGNDKYNAELAAAIKKSGFTVTTSLDNVVANNAQRWVVMDPVAGKPAAEGRGNWLGKALDKSIEVLNRSGKGFFLMAEAAQIDDGGHENNLPKVVSEMLDFDQVIAKALQFADQDGETLVIITADHETGGLTLLEGDYATGIVGGHFSTDDHTAIPVPVFAYGPQSDLFKGVYENIEVFNKIMQALGLKKK
ncbi:alkaline phosphatase [Pseudoflavitalea sp. G-6-1-2]|uniref:alkaline phosphatase n=1 Tax=Pseudoflavitalea sp. G-6-1-2 TaxID=2728841 RepID=UPI00146E35BA|nr:alkaline phosphatase [Pseudoflavitalea sp. G-6-1-2]NML22637.1 alkaline phosphatase [Pseudoflavitalea sp. G-6-1-2]